MLNHKIVDHILIITLESPRIDVFLSQNVRKQILEVIDAEKKDQVILDLSNVEFMDSAGLVSFLAIWKALRKKEGDLKLANVQSTVQQIIELVQLNRIFSIYPTVQQALDSYKSNSIR